MSAKWSKLPPRKPCFVIFKGWRQMGNLPQYEQVKEPVEVREIMRGMGEKELVIAMTGRQKLFRLDAFAGEWQVIDLGAA